MVFNQVKGNQFPTCFYLYGPLCICEEFNKCGETTVYSRYTVLCTRSKNLLILSKVLMSLSSLCHLFQNLKDTIELVICK